MATRPSEVLAVVAFWSCAQAQAALCACSPTSQEPRTSDDPSRLPATGPSSASAAHEPRCAAVLPSPVASSDRPANTETAGPVGGSAHPADSSPPVWRIANERYSFSPHAEDPPPLERCGVLADKKGLQRHRPAGATSIATVQCLPLGEGRAWGIVRARGRWAAAYAARPGHLAVGPWSPEYPTRSDREETLFTSATGDPPEALFDWDGDGVLEYLHPVILTDPGSGGNAVVYGELWSYRAGKVVHLPQAPLGIRLVRDLDDDGRPDLLVSPFQGKLAFGICFDVFDANSGDVSEGLFAAHSLPDGTFALADQVATDFAKTWCKEPPSLDSSANAYRAIPCARAWGMDARILQPLIDAHCHDQIERCPAGKCIDRPVLERWTKIDAPVLLELF